MSNIVELVIALGLLYLGLKFAWKLLKFVGILVIVVFIFKMVALIL